MSLTTVLDGVVRTITSHADYSCSNVYRNDHRHLNAGQERYVVVGFGSLQSNEIILGGIFDHNWTVGLDVYTRYTGQYPTTLDNANVNLQSILDTFEADNTLADTTGVHRVAVVAIGPITPMDAPTGRVAHVFQQISLLVQEEP
jgi:hypothetical protein